MARGEISDTLLKTKVIMAAAIPVLAAMFHIQFILNSINHDFKGKNKGLTVVGAVLDDVTIFKAFFVHTCTPPSSVTSSDTSPYSLVKRIFLKLFLYLPVRPINKASLWRGQIFSAPPVTVSNFSPVWGFMANQDAIFLPEKYAYIL